MFLSSASEPTASKPSFLTVKSEGRRKNPAPLFNAARKYADGHKPEKRRVKTFRQHHTKQMKHTKGPWFNYIAPHGTRHILPCSEPTLGTVQICTFNGSFHRKHDEMEANARLIAAAPDLLDALNESLGYIQMRGAKLDLSEKALDELCAKVLKAIAKAEGGAKK